MSEPPLVWITRAEPGASATAARIQAIGFRPLVSPLLTVRSLPAELDLTGVAALAFTSTNGVRAFAAREPERGLPVFAVGDTTAKAARLAGFAAVQSANGDVIDLCRLIVAAKPEGLILNPGGRERAGDMVGYLSRHGLPARAVALYDTPAAETLPEAALEARAVDAVLLHSPRGATILAARTAPFDLSEMTAFGFSAHCLRPLRTLGFAKLVKAERPREDALLDALLATLGNPPHGR